MADGSGRDVGETLFTTLHVRDIREDVREVDFVCSSDAVDAHGTKLEQKWQLARYKDNPVVLFAHKSKELAIGQARKVEVVNGRLEATVWFTKTTELAEQVFQQVLEKTMRGISVGFIPHSYRWEKVSDDEVLVCSDIELLELSVCPVPSNPEALAKIRARAVAERSDVTSQVKSIPTHEAPRPPKRGVEETIMANEADTKALEQRVADQSKTISDKDAVVLALTKERDAAIAEHRALEGQTKRLVEERDAQAKRADEAEGQLIEHEVTSLIGRKITAAEKEDFVELRKTNKALFERMVEQRTVMPHTSSVIADAKVETDSPSSSARTTDEADLEAFNKRQAS